MIPFLTQPVSEEKKEYLQSMEEVSKIHINTTFCNLFQPQSKNCHKQQEMPSAD